MDTKLNRSMQVSRWCVALALTFVLSLAVSSQGQNTPSTPSRDNDTTAWQLSSVDRFFDSHPEIADQLRKDPSLINNRDFVQSHPELQQYLQEHPGVREEFSENPNAFMRQEQRYDRREDAQEFRQNRGDKDKDNDLTLRELASIDRFFDSHPEIGGQLRKDPSLINNKDFVQSHPALQQYLQEHPAVREEFSDNPNAFMRQEQRYDRREDTQEFRQNRGDKDAQEFRQNRADKDNDLTLREMASIDRFFDSHPEVGEQLRKDPSLINNKDFVQSHPALQQYLQEHPAVREEFSENPNGFMRQEQRYDRREDAQDFRQNRGDQNRRDNDNDLTRRELGSMDRFLDSHPETAEQLRKNPSLINNKDFVQSHPALQQYLQEHPSVREEFSENPNGFMRQEQRYDRREDAQEFRQNRGDQDFRQNRGDNDLTRRELGSMDRFLDSHPETAEQLRKNPSLINNKEFVQSHPALQQYLQEHPAVREEFSENPNAAMRQEQRYDRREDAQEFRQNRGDQDFRQNRGDNDLTRRDLGNIDRFLDSHPETAEQLRKNPSLINNKEFVQSHPALQQYLQANPAVRQQFSQNPNAVMQQEQRYDQREDAANFRNPKYGREETSFGDFLRGHSAMANELSKNPSLANNKQYLQSHPELQSYLKDHPAVQQKLSENPQSVMTSPTAAGSMPKTTTSTPPLKPEGK